MAQQHLPWNIIEAVERGAPRVLLYGPPGTGKTTSAYNAAATLGKSLYSITLSDETPAAELRGHFVPIGTEWKWMHGPAVRAYLEGAVLVLDEIDKASQDCLDFLHGLLNDKKLAGHPVQISLPNGETISPHDDFQVIATMNAELEDLPPALQDRFAIAIEVQDPHPDAIAALPKDLRSAAKKVEDYEASERPATLRKWAAFAMLREIEEVGAMNAAKAIFAHRAGELLDAIKFKETDAGEGGIVMKTKTKAKRTKTKPATATMKAKAARIRTEDGFCDCEDCVEGRAWDWVGHVFGLSVIEEVGGAFECPQCGAGHGSQNEALYCCFVEDRWLIEGRKVGLV